MLPPSPFPEKERPVATVSVGPDEHAHAVRVRYADSDQMGVAYYANYLVWFEVGRTEWLRSRGYTYRALESEGVFLPVTEAACRYLAPSRYDDLVWWACLLQQAVEQFANGMLFIPDGDNNTDFHVRELPTDYTDVSTCAVCGWLACFSSWAAIQR